MGTNNVTFHIAVVFWKDKWLPEFVKHLETFAPSEYKIWSYYTDTDVKGYEEKFHFLEETDLSTHPGKLNRLAENICKVASPDDIIVFTDSDMLFFAPWHEWAIEMVENHKLIAIRRDENNGDRQPHPSFCATTVGFWKEIGGDWGAGGRGWTDNKGRTRKDTGSKLLDVLNDRRINWYPIRRTSSVGDHPVFFGVYGSRFYHHGAGSRPVRCRWDLDQENPEEQIAKNTSESRKILEQIKDNLFVKKEEAEEEYQFEEEVVEVPLQIKIPKDQISAWSIDEQEAQYLVDFVKSKGINSVAEFGAGVSTGLFSQLVSPENLITFEHSQEWIHKVRDDYHCRHEFYKYEQGNEIPFPIIKKYDLAFVDGPPAMHVKEGGFARVNTCELAAEIADTVILHDSKRDGERNTVNKVFGSDWSKETFDSKRGLTILRRRKDPNNFCFVTVVDGGAYYECLKVMLFSLRKQMHDLFPFFVIGSGLTVTQIKELRAIYNNLQFWPVPLDVYTQHRKNNPKYWAFELFRIGEHVGLEKVIFFDADLLFLKNPEQILSFEFDMAMVHEVKRNVFNSGVMVVGKKHLNTHTWSELMQMKRDKRRHGFDQQLINRYFEGQIEHLPREYNTLVSEVGNDFDTIKTLHFIYKPTGGIGSKQLPKSYKKIWTSVQKEMQNVDS